MTGSDGATSSVQVSAGAAPEGSGVGAGASVGPGPGGGRPARARVRTLARVLGRELAPVVGMGVPALLRHPIWAPDDEGRGLGVVVVPGFGGADSSMAMLRRWLDRRGYRAIGARLGLNLGCSAELADRLAGRVEEHVRDTGGPVVLIGHSRGGWLGRLVAVRRPDLVRGVVMLGTPVLDPLDTRGVVTAAITMLPRLSALGVRGLLDTDCVAGECREATAAGLAAPLTVPGVAVYSRSDGVVGWESCRDPDAEWVEVAGSHTGMGTDPEVYGALAPRLACWTAIGAPSRDPDGAAGD